MILALIASSLLSVTTHAVPVSVQALDLAQIPSHFTANSEIRYVSPTTVQFNLNEDQLLPLAQLMHQLKGRCGGFIVGDQSKAKALKNLHGREDIPTTLARQVEVLNLFPQVKEEELTQTIRWFSSYPTRNYQTATGIAAMKDLAVRWQSLIAKHPAAEVKLWKHSDWEQPSVILQFKGESEEEIILSAHGDSINTDSGDIQALAPGADDNASGVAVLTEIIRVLANNNYRPKRTLTFISYAAEEYGLRGSMEITASYAEQKKLVKGVLNFDETNFKGTPELGMTLIEDLTDPKLNNLLIQIIEQYLKVQWAYDRCGYACSDHYSWTYRGYPAAIPFESLIANENTHIHTAGDVFSVSDENAYHSVPFVRLGLAFALELDQ